MISPLFSEESEIDPQSFHRVGITMVAVLIRSQLTKSRQPFPEIADLKITGDSGSSLGTSTILIPHRAPSCRWRDMRIFCSVVYFPLSLSGSFLMAQTNSLNGSVSVTRTKWLRYAGDNMEQGSRMVDE